MIDKNKVIPELISMCKRRGYIFQSSEIYGGINGFWDFGPLGVELKNAIKNFWWKSMVQDNENIFGLDASIIMHPSVWEASGHVQNFTDPMVDCKECKGRYKMDSLEGDKCPECGGDLTEAKLFNLMFKTFVGATESGSSTAFLRPETAQAIFVNYKNIQTSARAKIPFGIAQIGKAFRNEINPRNFIYRSREFEQMEMQFFVHPDEMDKWFDYWMDKRFQWHLGLGLSKDNIKLRQHESNELAHYAKDAYDVEFNFPFGWHEYEGIHNRGQYDLGAHVEHSGKDLKYFNPETKERFVPGVIETSIGVERTLMTVLIDGFDLEEINEKDSRYVLRIHQNLAPVQIAVMPLSKKLLENAAPVEEMLRKHFRTQFDYRGSIGKLYRRQDEVGTPFCVTYDFDSVEDNSVTIRERDSMSQTRISIDSLLDYFMNEKGLQKY